MLSCLKKIKKETVEPERVKKPFYEMPEIVVVPEVKFSLHGKYNTKSGKAKGLVVHYTVSGRSEKSARGVLNYLASKGLGCMVMDEHGVIYVAGNVKLNESVAYHAGTSHWQGVSGMSRYCMGMEICCWGRLDGNTAKHAKTKKAVSEQMENMAPGVYETYTEAQEKALINFILWQVDCNEEFNLDWVVGHDEVAPGRKTDPGGSLSMTMPRFREFLKGKLNAND